MIGRLLRGVWSILDPVTINVNLPPDVCVSMLEVASRPSTDRLHLRDAFVEGRRYFIESVTDGFRMATTSKTLFNRQRRTDASCVLYAQFAASSEGQTSIAVSARLRWITLIYTFWLPAAMIWLLLPVPWPRGLVTGVLVAIFGLAWAALRYGAKLEANEMVYFIQKTFEDVPKFSLGALPASAENVIGGRDFDRMWEQFIRNHQPDS